MKMFLFYVYLVFLFGEVKCFEVVLFGGDEVKEWIVMSCVGVVIGVVVIEDFNEIGGFLKMVGCVFVLVGKGYNGGDVLLVV